MKISIIIVLMTLCAMSTILKSCNRVGISNNQKIDQPMIGTLNKIEIASSLIDSIAYVDLYHVRKKHFDVFITRRVINEEASRRGMDPIDLYRQEILGKVNIDESDFNSSRGLLKQRQYSYVDSLIDSKHSIESFLERPSNYVGHFDEITQGLISYRPNEPEIIFIIDFDCSSCINTIHDYIHVFSKYSGLIAPVFIPFSINSDLRHYAAIAAIEAGKSLKFIEFLTASSNEIDKDRIVQWCYSNILIINDMSYRDLVQEMEVKHSIITQSILSRKIYFVPSIIVNGILMPNAITPSELERIIIESLLI